MGDLTNQIMIPESGIMIQGKVHAKVHAAYKQVPLCVTVT